MFRVSCLELFFLKQVTGGGEPRDLGVAEIGGFQASLKLVVDRISLAHSFWYGMFKEIRIFEIPILGCLFFFPILVHFRTPPSFDHRCRGSQSAMISAPNF
jgi:hypothetical protein